MHKNNALPTFTYIYSDLFCFTFLRLIDCFHNPNDRKAIVRQHDEDNCDPTDDSDVSDLYD